MWFHLFCYLRNPFNPCNQVWWILNCGKSMKEKLSWSSTPCLIKCSRFLRLLLESHSLNGEPEGNQCVASAQKPQRQKEKDPAKWLLWSSLITEGISPRATPPRHLFHSRNQNDTWLHTPVRHKHTETNTTTNNRSIRTCPNALPRESWESSSAAASVSCLKGEWDDIPSRQSHPRQAALWSHHSPDQ